MRHRRRVARWHGHRSLLVEDYHMNDNARHQFENLDTGALETATGGANPRAFLALQKKLRDPSYSLLKDGYSL